MDSLTLTDKVMIGILSLSVIIGIYRIYSKSDGIRGMSLPEFQKMMAFFLFYVGIIYIIRIEANRPRVEHVFGDLWLAFMITGLFSSLHMDDFLAKMTSLINAIVALRYKQPLSQTSATIETKAEIK